MPAELKQAIQQSHGVPVEVVDEDRNERYVPIRAEVYERLKNVFDNGPLTEEQKTQMLLDAGKRAGWDDPTMDVYNVLDPRRRQ